MPIVRSLCINDPFDEKVYDLLYQYQFLFGDALLVIPVTSAEKSKKFYLPSGKWFNLLTDELFSGNKELRRECLMSEIPLYVKSSSIIPMQSLIQSTKQKPCDTLFLHVYNGDLPNQFEYYEDDGNTMDYEKGIYYKRMITFDPAEKQIFLSVPQGNFSSVFKTIQCIFHGFKSEMKEVTVNGQPKPVIVETIKPLDGLRYLEDIYDPAYYKSLRDAEAITAQGTITFPNIGSEIRINWE
jgi:alpha-glucosidase